MSWDIVLFKNKIDLADKSAVPHPIGQREEILSQLLAFEPAIHFTDAAWGTYSDGQIHIEINLGENKEIDVVMLHIRGNGDPLGFIVKICRHFNWFAFDGSAGEYLDLNAPSADSWLRWQNYRDQAKG